MLSVGPLWGLTVTARGAPSTRPMGKKNAAAGLGLAAVAARVTAANTRAVVRVGRMKPPLGHGRIHICEGSMPDYGLDRCDGHHEMVDFRLRKIGARRYQDNKESPGIAGASSLGMKHTQRKVMKPPGSPTVFQSARHAM